MKTNLTLIFLITCSILSAQNVTKSDKIVDGKEVANDYDRLSLTYILLDYRNGKYYDMMKQAYKGVYVSDKYDDNSINNPLLIPSNQDWSSSHINEALVSRHYVNSVIAKWFSRKSDGSFGVELMHNRGLYNATDADVLTAKASKLGMAKIMDAGENLLNNSFIIVYDINDLIDKEENYDREQQKSKTTVQRLKNGFIANITAYVYQIDFNDSISSIFFNQLWADPGDTNLASKKEAFDNFEFPLKLYARTNTRLESSQWNPGYSVSPPVQASKESLMFDLVQGGISNSLSKLEEEYAKFRVTAVLYKTWPLRSKIGKKEGLEKDQRYFVFQMVQDKSGQVNGKRKGVVRANYVTDNRVAATGQSQTSRFYQVAGQTLKKGMTLQQKNDLGGALSIGATQGGVNSLDARIEINMTQNFYKKLPSMSKFYLEGGYQPASFEVSIGNGSSTTYTNFARFGLGVGKEFCFLRNFRLQPFIGFGLEQIYNKDDSKIFLQSLYVRPGVTFGMNVKHNVQLFGQYSNFMMDYSIMDKDKKEVTVNGYSTWSKAFNRGGDTYAFGIRFEM